MCRLCFSSLIDITGFCLFFFLALQEYAFAQKSQCDPNLPRNSNDPYGYRDRGNRCEGLYIREVSGSTLPVVSFTAAFENYDLDSDQPLRVTWQTPAPRQFSMHLQAQGIWPRLYYRMDTSRPADSTSYTWSTNLLAALNISKDKLGILGWYRRKLGKDTCKVHVPLRLTQRQRAAPSDTYQLVLLPGRELQNVYLSLAPVNNNGTRGRFVYSDSLLDARPYLPESTIFIPIRFTDLKAPGIYYLRIGATLVSGGVKAEEFWFYHAGTRR